MSLVSGIEAQKHINAVKNKLESHNLDFKEKFPKNASDISKLFSAFANHEGGDIYFGIQNESREIVGIYDLQNLEERVSGVRNKCDSRPFIDFFIYELPEGKILRVHIYKSNSPISSDDKYYFRDINTSLTRILSSLEISKMLKNNQ